VAKGKLDYTGRDGMLEFTVKGVGETSPEASDAELDDYETDEKPTARGNRSDGDYDDFKLVFPGSKNSASD